MNNLYFYIRLAVLVFGLFAIPYGIYKHNKEYMFKVKLTSFFLLMACMAFEIAIFLTIEILLQVNTNIVPCAFFWGSGSLSNGVALFFQAKRGENTLANNKIISSGISILCGIYIILIFCILNDGF